MLTVFNRSPLAFGYSDMNRTMIEVNPQMCKMLGYTKEELMGMRVEDFSVKEDDEKNLKLMQAMVRGEIEHFSMEKRYIRKDGKIIIGNLIITTIGKENRYILAIIEDITEQKAMEEKQRKQEQILIQQNKMAAMGEMIGVIAHQWRQPLSVLALLVQNVQDAYENGGFSKEFLDESVTKSMVQIEYMSKTIDDFRNFYRPSKEKKAFDIKTSVLNVLRLIDAQLEHNAIEVKLECPEEVFTIESYKNEFEQSLLNIFTNAKDAIITRREAEKSLEGRITIRLSKKDTKIVLEIQDNGTGIKQEMLERIFEPYFTTKIKSKGTGMGLYMSKMIIEENMDGKISVKNNDDNRGTTFAIEL